MKNNLIKTLSKIALVLIPTMTISMTATAHDPKLHAKKAEKADCSKMDHSKMDMKDPVAIAMMKKCMDQAKALSDKMEQNKMKDMDHSKMKKMSDKKMNKEDHKNH